MFAFTKEQRQAKLARTNVDNYNKLELSLSKVTDSLQREAISNAMADIVDIFTMLRSTYDLSKSVKTTEDYRLLRVAGMPGIIIDYKWIANDPMLHYTDIYAKKLNINGIVNVRDYLVKALLKNKREQLKQEYSRISSKYSITLPFTINKYNTLVCLLSAYTQEVTELDTYMVVSSQYCKEICQEFAHHNNIDILISI